MKPVGCLRIDDDLGILGSRPHCLDRIQRNTVIEFAVKTQHGHRECRRNIKGVCRLQVSAITLKAAIPGNSGTQIRIMGGIEPNNTATPAESRNAQAAQIAIIGGGPGSGGIQIGHDLGIGDFTDNFGKNGWNIANLANIALSHIQIGCDREVAQLGKAAANILNILVNAKNFLNHHHHRQIGCPCRLGTVSRNLAIGSSQTNKPSRQPIRRGANDRLTHSRSYCQSKASR